MIMDIEQFIEKLIEIENNSARFYSLASNRFESELSKIAKSLSEDELEHSRNLRKYLVGKPSLVQFVVDENTFSGCMLLPDFSNDITKKEFLTAALRHEKNTINLYEHIIENNNLCFELINLINELINEEKEHMYSIVSLSHM